VKPYGLTKSLAADGGLVGLRAFEKNIQIEYPRKEHTMADVTRTVVVEGKNLGAGESKVYHWNHAPYLAVFAFSVHPTITFQNNNFIDAKPALAEVRNVKYRYKKAIEFVQSAELEVYFEVHNLCEYTIDYVVTMATIM
jgi:hypothetical protein